MKSMLRGIKKKFNKSHHKGDHHSSNHSAHPHGNGESHHHKKHGGSGGNQLSAGKKQTLRPSREAQEPHSRSRRRSSHREPHNNSNNSNAFSNGSSTPKANKRPEYLELLKHIPNLADVPTSKKHALFLRKLKLCSIQFDWSQWAEVKTDEKELHAKEIKRQQLAEITELFGPGKARHQFADEATKELVDMVAANLFRTLPPPELGPRGEPDEDDEVFEPSWPHLQIVYEVFLRFIMHSPIDMREKKRYVDHKFVLQLLELFNTEDVRERDYLKTTLHRIYAKFMSMRSFIRKSINNVFYTFIYETGRHNGIAELLEIMGSIINGFALPLKPEHQRFLRHVLTPMHKVKCLANFHQQLSYCVTQFVEKDPTLSIPVTRGLIKYWPVINSSKEVMYLNELEELLELTRPEEFRILVPILFQQLGKSIGSPHFQVAERALYFWHNEYVASMIAECCVPVLGFIYPTLHANSLNHWNPTVKNLTISVLESFQELDWELVEECSNRYAEEGPRAAAAKHQRVHTWGALSERQRALTGGDASAADQDLMSLDANSQPHDPDASAKAAHHARNFSQTVEMV